MAIVSVLRITDSAALAVALALAWTVAVPAQNPSAPNPVVASRTVQPVSKHSRISHAAKAEPQAPPESVRPPDPPPPDWPVNDKAVPASVNWNGRDLAIAATNSSLKQILTDVSTATGVKVEGAETDQRIYGSFGPAPARDVLSKLLDGSGYNVLMIGDQGEGTPRELVLTARTHAAPSPAGNAQSRQNSEDDAVEEPEPPEQNVPPQRRPFGVPPMQNMPGRTPEQLLQEQQRQQQIQQQQQIQPPTPQPQNTPPPNEQ